MKNLKLALLALAALAVMSPSLASPWRITHAQRNGEGGGGATISYPPTKKSDTVDIYFGTSVPDPYRWLEDNESPEVAAWVEAENKVTSAYLDKISYRAAVKDRLM